jgi:RNA polymerase sigma-70 factor, ECF subfamily
VTSERHGDASEGRDLAALVGAARRGERAAFEEIVRRTYADTYTLALRLTADEHDANDVVQDAYLRAYRGLRRFRGEARFTTWLYRITANCAATSLGRQARARHDLLEEDAPVVDSCGDHDPEVRTVVNEQRADLARALAGLPWRLRQVIVLYDIYDLPHAAIATELSITEAAAKVRLHRARRRLRDVLDPASPEKPAEPVPEEPDALAS